MPLYVTSSSVFPLDPALSQSQVTAIYPEWLVFLVRINPITYAVDALRGILLGFNQFVAWYGPAIACGMALGFFLIALWDFRRA